MYYLDAASILRLSHVSKRFYHLTQDDYVWMNVDMSTLPYMDIRNTKKFIDLKLHPKLHTIKIQSSYELRGKAARKPRVDLGVLNALIDKCPEIIDIELLNCDLTFITNARDNHCRLLSLQSIRKVSLISCNTLIHWLELANWPSLTHLSLKNTVKTSEFEIKAISRNASWKNTLEFLDLTGCYRVNDACVKTLCMSNDASLLTLILSGTSVTKQCLQYLPDLCRLKELHLENCRGLKIEDMGDIPTLLPSLKVFGITKKSGNLVQGPVSSQLD